jgi:hypothetical protein
MCAFGTDNNSVIGKPQLLWLNPECCKQYSTIPENVNLFADCCGIYIETSILHFCRDHHKFNVKSGEVQNPGHENYAV